MVHRRQMLISQPCERYTAILLIFALSAICTCSVVGQDKPAQLPAAPPLKALSKQERTQLNDLKDEKAHIRRTLEFTALRLQHAQEFTTQQKYDSALMELGGYLALVEDALEFLSKLNHDSKKARDLYKQLELALREDAPRLTVLRRDTPLEYAIRMKEVEERAREGRTEALNAFYGQTVMREDKLKKSVEDKPKDNTSKPEVPPK
jgi:hypothetical protein